MRILIVEDDFISRKVLEKQLASYGEVDVTVNGREALGAVRMQLDQGAPYNLICLDIMMPEMDGQEALREIRAAEKEASIAGLERARIIMTTALNDSKDILSSFRDECDGYLVKPIKKQDIKKLFDMLEIDPPVQ
ncbi:MAG TPA: response regulator [Oceanipulchritudo sp.]|nr:response regulator [Oceanipulchritudo sp.]